MTALAVVDFIISTSGNFEYESMTTKSVSPVGNGRKNPCEVYPMVWRAICVVEEAVADHHARGTGICVTMLNKLFRIFVNSRPPHFRPQGLFCFDNALMTFVGMCHGFISKPCWNDQLSCTEQETVWCDSEFFSHCIKGMMLCPDTRLDTFNR